MKFKVEKITKNLVKNPSGVDIVCYDKSVRKHFPPPYQTFKLVIDDKEYITSVRNLKSCQTRIAKTQEVGRGKIVRADLCRRHALQVGQEVCIVEVVTPQKVYRLTRT